MSTYWAPDDYLTCRGCQKLSRYYDSVTKAGICLGMPNNPDPKCDLMRLCFIKQDDRKEVNITPGELAKLYEVINEVVIHYFTYLMALMEVDEDEL